jgi:hypothetical protein
MKQESRELPTTEASEATEPDWKRREREEVAKDEAASGNGLTERDLVW